MLVSRVFSIFAAAALIAASVAPSDFSESGKQKSWLHIFSSHAIGFSDYERDEPFKLNSPDGKKAVVWYHVDGEDYYDWHVSVNAFGKRFQTTIGGDVDAEVFWAPDSKAFAETFSEAGAVGLYHVRVFSVDENGLHFIEPTEFVKKEFFSHPRRCFDPEDPNIGAIAWVGDSSHIVVAAETLPHSNCDGMGTFRAYEISLPGGSIEKSYNQLQAKSAFRRDMGVELLNADDECVRRPKSCWIPQLHEYANRGIE
jgi:hypothetical protein